MCKEEESVLKTVTFWKKEDENDFETVMIKFEPHSLPKKNTSHKKAMFHLSAQCPGECVTIFVRALYELADGCNFTNKNEEIKDIHFWNSGQWLIGMPSAYSRIETQQSLRIGKKLWTNQNTNQGKIDKKHWWGLNEREKFQ